MKVSVMTEGLSRWLNQIKRQEETLSVIFGAVAAGLVITGSGYFLVPKVWSQDLLLTQVTASAAAEFASGIEQALSGQSDRNERMPGSIWNKIRLWWPIKPEGEITKTAVSTTTAPSDAQQEINVVVVKGDTLWGLAQKYYDNGWDWELIAEANGITDTRRIEIGQKLTVPVTNPARAELPTQHQVEKGENLWKIAQTYYGDGNKYPLIAGANRELIRDNPRVIEPGWFLAIPVDTPSASQN